MPTKFTVLAAAVAALSLSLVDCASTPAASTSASAPAGAFEATGNDAIRLNDLAAAPPASRARTDVAVAASLSMVFPFV